MFETFLCSRLLLFLKSPLFSVKDFRIRGPRVWKECATEIVACKLLRNSFVYYGLLRRFLFDDATVGLRNENLFAINSVYVMWRLNVRFFRFKFHNRLFIGTEIRKRPFAALQTGFCGRTLGSGIEEWDSIVNRWIYADYAGLMPISK